MCTGVGGRGQLLRPQFVLYQFASHLQRRTEAQIKESAQICIDPFLRTEPGCKIQKIGASLGGK